MTILLQACVVMFLTHSFHYLSRISNTTHYREKGHKKFLSMMTLATGLCGHVFDSQ
ncbi:hypothetical protein ESSG_03185, partial [Escherichia coli H730]